MQLQDYLEKYNLKATPWAIMSGLSAATISRFLNKNGKLSLDNAIKITKITNNEVTLSDLCDFLLDDKV